LQLNINDAKLAELLGAVGERTPSSEHPLPTPPPPLDLPYAEATKDIAVSLCALDYLQRSEAEARARFGQSEAEKEAEKERADAIAALALFECRALAGVASPVAAEQAALWARVFCAWLHVAATACSSATLVPSRAAAALELFESAWLRPTELVAARLALLPAPLRTDLERALVATMLACIVRTRTDSLRSHSFVAALAEAPVGTGRSSVPPDAAQLVDLDERLVVETGSDGHAAALLGWASMLLMVVEAQREGTEVEADDEEAEAAALAAVRASPLFRRATYALQVSLGTGALGWLASTIATCLRHSHPLTATLQVAGLAIARELLVFFDTAQMDATMHAQLLEVHTLSLCRNLPLVSDFWRHDWNHPLLRHPLKETRARWPASFAPYLSLVAALASDPASTTFLLDTELDAGLDTLTLPLPQSAVAHLQVSGGRDTLSVQDGGLALSIGQDLAPVVVELRLAGGTRGKLLRRPATTLAQQRSATSPGSVASPTSPPSSSAPPAQSTVRWRPEVSPPRLALVAYVLSEVLHSRLPLSSYSPALCTSLHASLSLLHSLFLHAPSTTLERFAALDIDIVATLVRLLPLATQVPGERVTARLRMPGVEEGEGGGGGDEGEVGAVPIVSFAGTPGALMAQLSLTATDGLTVRHVAVNGGDVVALGLSVLALAAASDLETANRLGRAATALTRVDHVRLIPDAETTARLLATPSGRDVLSGLVRLGRALLWAKSPAAEPLVTLARDQLLLDDDLEYHDDVAVEVLALLRELTTDELAVVVTDSSRAVALVRLAARAVPTYAGRQSLLRACLALALIGDLVVSGSALARALLVPRPEGFMRAIARHVTDDHAVSLLAEDVFRLFARLCGVVARSSDVRPPPLLSHLGPHAGAVCSLLRGAIATPSELPRVPGYLSFLQATLADQPALAERLLHDEGLLAAAADVLPADAATALLQGKAGPGERAAAEASVLSLFAAVWQSRSWHQALCTKVSERPGWWESLLAVLERATVVLTTGTAGGEEWLVGAAAAATIVSYDLWYTGSPAALLDRVAAFLMRVSYATVTLDLLRGGRWEVLAQWRLLLASVRLAGAAVGADAPAFAAFQQHQVTLARHTLSWLATSAYAAAVDAAPPPTDGAVALLLDLIVDARATDAGAGSTWSADDRSTVVALALHAAAQAFRAADRGRPLDADAVLLAQASLSLVHSLPHTLVLELVEPVAAWLVRHSPAAELHPQEDEVLLLLSLLLAKTSRPDLALTCAEPAGILDLLLERLLQLTAGGAANSVGSVLLDLLSVLVATEELAQTAVRHAIHEALLAFLAGVGEEATRLRVLRLAAAFVRLVPSSADHFVLLLRAFPALQRQPAPLNLDSLALTLAECTSALVHAAQTMATVSTSAPPSAWTDALLPIDDRLVPLDIAAVQVLVLLGTREFTTDAATAAVHLAVALATVGPLEGEGGGGRRCYFGPSLARSAPPAVDDRPPLGALLALLYRLAEELESGNSSATTDVLLDAAGAVSSLAVSHAIALAKLTASSRAHPQPSPLLTEVDGLLFRLSSASRDEQHKKTMADLKKKMERVNGGY
jgi:hypothetical protein